MDLDDMGKPCHSPLLGVKDPSFHVVDTTYFWDGLCIYIVEFIKETYMGLYCSIWQRKHSHSAWIEIT